MNERKTGDDCADLLDRLFQPDPSDLKHMIGRLSLSVTTMDGMTLVMILGTDAGGCISSLGARKVSLLTTRKLMTGPEQAAFDVDDEEGKRQWSRPITIKL
jgi:hypothetical protein